MKQFSAALLLLCLISDSYAALNTKWELSYYIWNFGIIARTDKGLRKQPRDYFATEHQFDRAAYQNIKAGDVVWLRGRFIPRFYTDILPTLQVPIVLVIADGDESFPSNCCSQETVDALLAHPMITHIFAQNNDYRGQSTKVHHLPIGMDFHTVAYKGTQGGWGERGSPAQQEQQLQALLKTLKPTHARKKRAFVDFHLADTMHGDFKRYLECGEDRATIFKRIMQTGLIDAGSWMRRSLLWRTKGQYAFSVSPHGNGLDCHRTWEDLILGCIVIVKTSPLDPLYEGLPVVIVRDWSEITPENLDRWLARYGDAFENPLYREKLTTAYWLSKISAAAAACKGIGL